MASKCIALRSAQRSIIVATAGKLVTAMPRKKAQEKVGKPVTKDGFLEALRPFC